MATATQNGTGKTPGQIDMTRLDTKLVNKYAKAAGLKLGDTPEGTAQRLQEYYVGKARAQEIKIASCDECNGASDLDLPACPFCGTGDEPAAEAEAAAEVVQTPAKVAKPKAEKPKPAPIEAAGETVAKTTRKPRSSAAQTPAVTAPTTVVAETPETPAKPPKPPKRDKHDQQLTKVPGKRELAKLEALDKHCETIRNSTVGAATSLWEVGTALKAIHDSELWKLRSVEGVPVHTNFNMFVKDEFGISHTYAFSLMDVAVNYTAEDIKKLGVFKLKLMLAAPADKRDKMRDAAEGGATRQELKEMRDGKPSTPVITLAIMAGQQVIPGLSRTKLDKETGEPARAKSMKEDPYCEVQLENNARLIIRCTTDAEGNVSFIINTMREGQTVETSGETVSVNGQSVDEPADQQAEPKQDE